VFEVQVVEIMGKPYLMVDALGDNEVKNIKIIQSLLAEMLGTMFLVLVGCGSCYKHTGTENEQTEDDNFDYVRIALAFGVTVATIAQSIGHISGCHINPAVTVGLFVGGKIGLVKGILYIVMQCIGAMIGAGLLKAFIPGPLGGVTALGSLKIDNVVHKIGVGEGIGIELFITFVLVLCVYAPGTTPLAIGLSIATCHLFAIPLTGSSMNPARSFGPAVVANSWANHYVYWVGPILGGIAAALTSVFAFGSWERTLVVTTSENKPV